MTTFLHLLKHDSPPLARSIIASQGAGADARVTVVLLDGIDVRDICQSALRENIGIALQEAVLFSGAIADNIRHGKADASDETIEAAARAAQAEIGTRHPLRIWPATHWQGSDC